jgi:large subunit ribosomal protein L32
MNGLDEKVYSTFVIDLCISLFGYSLIASLMYMRRSHDGLTAPSYVECPQCHEMARPHHICAHCGYYKGKEVMEVESV